MKILATILTTLLCLLLSACLELEDYRDRNVARLEQGLFLGQHDLRRFEHTNSGSNLSGSFFLGSGDISATGGQSELRFFWEHRPNEVISTTMDYSMFRFVVDDKKEVPTVEFDFDEYWLRSNRYNIEYEKNANLIIQSTAVSQVIVRISQADLEKEIYLPQ